MILQSLDALYGRLRKDSRYAVAPPGFSQQKVTFKVVLAPAGELFDIQDARIPVDDKPRPRQVLVPGSTKSPGAGFNPSFLWDTSQYLLGTKVDDPDPDRTASAFEAFRQAHLDKQQDIGSVAYDAVCAFLRSWLPARSAEFPALADAAATGYGVFQIQGQAGWVHDDPAIQAWLQKGSNDAPTEQVGVCLVTGELSALAPLHDKIKSVMGAQGAGGSLVSFNAPAFESLGKEQSLNAPVSQGAAFRYATALNSLLDGPQRSKHRLTIGGTTVAFWTERVTATEDVFARFAEEGSALLDEPQDESTRQKLELFLRALREGREAYGDLDTDADHSPFCLLGLSPNAGRVAVRFFQRGALSELLDNLRRHHADIAMVRELPSGKRRGDPEFPSAKLLLRQTAREADGVPPVLAGPLLRSIVAGADYPHGLFAAVLRRIVADRDVTYPRVCALKGYLNRNLNLELPVSLDPSRPDPAYRLGRLFAALEKTQKDALGENLNKTVRDAYYASASATPGSVFPRLLRTYQHHLAKLEGGRKVARERLVQEIFDPLDALPTHLSLADQGLFAIGYYHQTRSFYTKKDEPSDSN